MALLDEFIGPVCDVHVDAAPEIYQVTTPLGADWPFTPLTTASNVIRVPTDGFEGFPAKAIVGTAVVKLICMVEEVVLK